MERRTFQPKILIVVHCPQRSAPSVLIGLPLYLLPSSAPSTAHCSKPIAATIRPIATPFINSGTSAENNVPSTKAKDVSAKAKEFRNSRPNECLYVALPCSRAGAATFMPLAIVSLKRPNLLNKYLSLRGRRIPCARTRDETQHDCSRASSPVRPYAPLLGQRSLTRS